MDKDNKFIWEELSKIRFWATIAAIPGSLFLYVLLSFYKPPEGSWLVPGRDWLMALITNFVPTLLISVFVYVFLRKLLAIKSKQVFQWTFEERPALYLDTSGGKILDEYYWSTLRLFDWGVRQGKIRRTWSLKAEPSS